MLALDFLSAPWEPSPISSLPTSCMSCSWRSCDSVWWRRLSCRLVSPSLSVMLRLAPARTSSRTMLVCCRSTARCSAVCRFTFWRSRLPRPVCTSSSATSTWLLRLARWSAVYPSSFFSSTIQGLGSLVRRTLMALGLPLRAAWWRALKPLLLVSMMSALWSSSSPSMSSLFLLMASWSGVSPSLSCRLGWQPSPSSIFTTPTCPLLTAMCSAVCRRLFRAFRSEPAAAITSITHGSSPKAAWCTARSPSLSSSSRSAPDLSSILRTSR